MKRITRLTESDLHRIVRESVKRVLREGFTKPSNWKDTEFKGTYTDENGALYMPDDDFDYEDDFDIAYDIKGHEIHKGDVVIWTDPETKRKIKYRVYEEPSSEMVKMANKYGECEALPSECVVVR